MLMVSSRPPGNFTDRWPAASPVRSNGSCPAPGSTRRSRPRATASAKRTFPPWVILWAWIGQALDADKSCNKALGRIQAHRADLGLPLMSSDTGGYCKARARLPDGLFARLCRRLGTALSRRARPEDLWHGRVVKVVDGSSSSMPDTAANQKAYPQPASQQDGCGFPVVAFVGVFCLATGAALDLALGRWFLHDLALFYFLRPNFQPGDIMLADRGFCSFAELALLSKRGVDTVARMHQARDVDFRRGRVLGVLDHIVTWERPWPCPRGLRKADYRKLPMRMLVREVRYRVEADGFRTNEITLATTLLDAEAYPVEDLAALYFRRWSVELNFEHIKTSMKMAELRGKTPGVVRKEIWTHLVAYNLIRAVMWETAVTRDVPADRISFKGTIQQIAVTSDLLAVREGRPSELSMHTLLVLVARQIVPYRPNRIEPRVRKRRPKPYPLMTQPRAELKAALRA